MKTVPQLYENMRPTTGDTYVGVEIEFFTSLRGDQVAMELAKLPISDFITLKGDGSIRPPYCLCGGRLTCSSCKGNWLNSFGHELNILVKQKNVTSVIRKVCAFIASIKGDVNETCGLHVHLDMRKRNKEKAFTNLLAIQNVLYGMNDIRREDNTYCSRLSPEIQLDTVLKSGLYSRYRGVNAMSIAEHGTIEVRMHHGTVDAGEIINWINLLVRAVDSKPYTHQDIRSLKDLRTRLRLPNRLLKQVEQRLEKYAGKRRIYA